jgi:hypothetical protein
VSARAIYGTWHNTDPDSSGVVALAFEHARVRAWASAGTRAALPFDLPFDLGEGEVQLYAGREDPSPVAFTARLPGGSADEVLLQGNINRGLMILAAYRSSADAAPLAGRFSREFYARRESGFVAPSSTSSGVLFGAIRASTQPVLEEFIGHWRNADPTSSLPSLELEADGPRLWVTVEGTGPRVPARWPRVSAQTFAYYDELGRDTLLLLGDFAHADGRSALQIKVVLGTAVVAAFHQRDDGRSWFTREFFRRPR